MSIEVKVPQLPESVADATLVAWHKSPGDTVSRDENLADLETDKVVLEVPAPADGVLKEIRIADGTTVTAGEILAILEPGDAAAAKSAGPAEKKSAAATGGDAAAATDTQPTGESEGDADDADDADDAAPGKAAGRLSPSVRRLVDEHGLDPADIRGTGRDGRISKADVMVFLDQQPDPAAAKRDDAAPGKAPAPPTPQGAREDRRVPMTRMRARIAERLVDAQASAAMLTSFNEVDLGAVMDIRKRYRDSFEKKHGVRIGFMSFFAKAAIEALRKFPVVNASLEGSDIIYHDYYDIGVAVSTERGLMVPVLRDVDLMSFADIERAIGAFAGKAREGKISVDDISGGTFTITNGGVFGSLMSTPILNPPQSAILGMHKIQERAMVVNGEIKIRPMMYIALTYDHRIIDGREAVQFLVSIKESLEDPARLLIQL
ncbi:MAG: 2-oxoglutarate dehydrogenase complex dihydrolipoyllysine-residue succinyltransferase [Gammaproteobacteria bacterium]